MKRTFDLRLSAVRRVQSGRPRGSRPRREKSDSPKSKNHRSHMHKHASDTGTLRSKLTGCEKKPKYTSLIRPIWQFIDDENFQKATKLEPHVSSKRSQCDFQRPAGRARR